MPETGTSTKSAAIASLRCISFEQALLQLIPYNGGDFQMPGVRCPGHATRSRGARPSSPLSAYRYPRLEWPACAADSGGLGRTRKRRQRPLCNAPRSAPTGRGATFECGGGWASPDPPLGGSGFQPRPARLIELRTTKPTTSAPLMGGEREGWCVTQPQYIGAGTPSAVPPSPHPSPAKGGDIKRTASHFLCEDQ